MRKVLILLALGVVVGYWWGWTDAQVNQEDVVTRMVNRAGGKTRSSVKANTDQTMDSLEQH
ncbi:MAG TPA: hypothetical protein VIC55_07235 [Gemmatimonadaceae bacterium]|jgi:hypothetical protein